MRELAEWGKEGQRDVVFGGVLRKSMRSVLYTKNWYRRHNGHWKVKGPAMRDFGVWETYVTYRMYSTVKEE